MLTAYVRSGQTLIRKVINLRTELIENDGFVVIYGHAAILRLIRQWRQVANVFNTFRIRAACTRNRVRIR